MNRFPLPLQVRAPHAAVSIKLQIPVTELNIDRPGAQPLHYKPSILSHLGKPHQPACAGSGGSASTLSTDDMVHVLDSAVTSILNFSSVRALLVSRSRRVGMEPLLKRHNLALSNLRPAAKGLMIHFHGGGFIAGSPYSHEFYLRTWSRELGMPILSVDYSLAPEHPFPRALQECIHAYLWALANAHRLGSTADHVYFTGDSAGGNLVVAVTLACIQLVCAVVLRSACSPWQDLPLPTMIFPFYPALNLELQISPARLISACDVMLSEARGSSFISSPK